MTTGRPSRQAFRRRQRAQRAAAALAGVFVLAAAPGAASAAEDGASVFLGQKVTPHRGTYLVVKDANVRALPKTKSKKLGSLKAGTRIDVVARAAGAWVAYRSDGKDMGFVYDQILMPLIDGTLAADLKGSVAAKDGPACAYRIHFDGKSAVEGQEFEISDYDVDWDCKTGKRRIKFRTPMFITEAPYQLNVKPVYQINVDILDLFDGYDEIFSTIVLYDRDKRRVSFDGVSIKKYGRQPKPGTAAADDVPQALDAAVRIAYGAWNAAAWKDLIKNMPASGG